MKALLTSIISCLCFVSVSAQYKPPYVPEFAVEGARWYYKNVGKNSDVIKHIYVERNGNATVNALNFKTKKYEDFTGSRLIFHYLREDSTVAGYDTLIIQTDTFFIGFYRAQTKVFDYLYARLGSQNQPLYSTHPFAGDNENYKYKQGSFQILKQTICATINNRKLAFYDLNAHPCSTYPLGDEIIERIGPTYYMFRFDSCLKDMYGGPLLWYYDPEIGYYEHGKTKVTLCDNDSTIINNIAEGFDAEKSPKLYPVPFSNILNLEATTTNSLVRIYAVNGKCLFTVNLNAYEKLTIDTRGWPAGVYIAKHQSKDGIVTSKIIKH